MVVAGSLISLSPGGLRKTVVSSAFTGRIRTPNRERTTNSLIEGIKFKFKPIAQRLFK